MNVARRYPAVERKPDYAPTGAEPGYDGRPPLQAPARDIEAKDQITGKMRRETPDGPENVNATEARAMNFRKKLTDRQFAAATRFQNDWEQSKIQPCAQLTGGGAGGGSRSNYQPVDAILDAQGRHHDAVIALGRWLGIVEMVVLQDLTLAQAAIRCGGIHHQRAAQRLEDGLDCLADHYGLPAA